MGVNNVNKSRNQVGFPNNRETSFCILFHLRTQMSTSACGEDSPLGQRPTHCARAAALEPKYKDIQFSVFLGSSVLHPGITKESYIHFESPPRTDVPGGIICSKSKTS